jgi:hypothetical protein
VNNSNSISVPSAGVKGTGDTGGAAASVPAAGGPGLAPADGGAAAAASTEGARRRGGAARRVARFVTGFVFALLPLVAVGASDNEPCRPVDHDFRDRFGRAPTARTQAQLKALFENPTFLRSGATHTDGPNDATIDILTESHVVYPIRVADVNAAFGEYQDLPSFVPNLLEHVVMCHPSPGISRQRQRTGFKLLVFSLGSDYVIDVEYVHNGPNAYSSRWVMVKSLDGRLAYLYGSWYFEAVRIDGVEATYVHHYGNTGLTTRVPGVRAFVDRRVDDGIRDVLAAVYEETVRRFGRSDAGS